MNLVELLLIRLKNRVKIQFVKTSKIFKLLAKKGSFFAFFMIILFKIIISISMSLFLYKTFYYETHKVYWTSFIFLGLYFNAIVYGMVSYKRTYFPIDISILKSSPLEDRNIYLFVLIEEYVWHCLNSIEFYLSSFLFLLFINLHHLLFFTYIFILGLSSSFFIFVFFNILYGNYKISLIKNPIGIFRFILYGINSVLFFEFGVILTKFIYVPTMLYKKILFPNNKLSLSDNTLKILENSLINDWLNPIKEYFFYLFNSTIDISKEFYNFISLRYLIFLIFGIILFFMIKIFSPKYNKNIFIKSVEINKKDFLFIYVLTLKKVNSVFNNKNFLVEKELNIIKNSRWLVSPSFYSKIIANYDFYFMTGVIITNFKYINSIGYIISLILLFNVLLIFNQVTELRRDHLFIYTLSSEKRNINLVKLSGNSIDIVYKSKLNLMRLNLLVPSIITFFISLYLTIEKINFMNYNFYLCIITSIFTLVYMIWFAPISVLYIEPMFSRFDYKNTEELIDKRIEENIYEKILKIPRLILFTPVLLILYFNVFFNYLDKIKNFFPFIFLIYFVIISVTFNYFFNYIKEKGIKKVDGENIYV
ncbi:hypothetical protein OSSY52_08790 [Tepiditoga spiralis]|uniref:Uncharacterized protein n=1 Tax=Tepiditoga spiralis TaxID=2108365 RepID=A0A7G1G2Z1_9BACT|nr:hypothetical protein [Tepiditoga spiralis]BBE30738.1 hypothetical protein OSSY52_08790 [Tepiditoga spiralis]